MLTHLMGFQQIPVVIRFQRLAIFLFIWRLYLPMLIHCSRNPVLNFRRQFMSCDLWFNFLILNMIIYNALLLFL